MVYHCSSDKEDESDLLTWNLGRTYSATRKVLVKTWPFTSTEMFQFPRTGLSAMSRLPAQTPLVVNSLFQFLTRFPAPSVIMTSMPPVTEGFSWGDKTTVRNWTVLPGL